MIFSFFKICIPETNILIRWFCHSHFDIHMRGKLFVIDKAKLNSTQNRMNS